MGEKSVWKAKSVRAVDLSSPSPLSRHSGRSSRQREKIEIETLAKLDVGSAQRASNANRRLRYVGIHSLTSELLRYRMGELAPGQSATLAACVRASPR